MTQPIETVSTRYRSLDLGIPRRLLANLLKRPDGHGGRRHEACLPLVSLMRSHVQALYRAAPQMTVEQMVSMQGATIALAAAALNGLVTEEHAQEVRNATLFSIQRFIEDRLHDLSLSTVSVCRYFSISRATLYRIMEPIGGFSGYLRSRRLHRVRHDLTHPNKSHLSVGELAEAWGFSSHPSFTKSFRETFGLSPRAYRAAASDAHSQVSEYEPEYTWSHWLAAMK